MAITAKPCGVRTVVVELPLDFSDWLAGWLPVESREISAICLISRGRMDGYPKHSQPPLCQSVGQLVARQMKCNWLGDGILVGERLQCVVANNYVPVFISLVSCVVVNYTISAASK